MTENVFDYNHVTAACLYLAKTDEEQLTKDSWIYDTGASFHICNNWIMMEDVVQGENRTTTTSNGGKQTGNLTGKVNLVVKCGQGKTIITLNDVLYIPNAPCNLVSEGKFYRKGLYLNAQRNLIHNDTQVIANCPMLDHVDVRILQMHPDHDSLD